MKTNSQSERGRTAPSCSPIELDEDTFYQIMEKGMKAANRYKRTVRGQTLTIHDDDTYWIIKEALKTFQENSQDQEPR